MEQWLLAWERYALAAVATGQLSFSASIRHKLVVAEIAANSTAEGRAPLLGVLFDKLSRKSWEDTSRKLQMAFDIDNLVGNQTEEMLRRARAAYDTLFPPGKRSEAPRT